MAAILRIVFPHLDHPSTLPRAPLLAAQQLRKHLRRTAAAAGTEEADPSLAPPAPSLLLREFSERLVPLADLVVPPGEGVSLADRVRHLWDRHLLPLVHAGELVTLTPAVPPCSHEVLPILFAYYSIAAPPPPCARGGAHDGQLLVRGLVQLLRDAELLSATASADIARQLVGILPECYCTRVAGALEEAADDGTGDGAGEGAGEGARHSAGRGIDEALSELLEVSLVYEEYQQALNRLALGEWGGAEAQETSEAGVDSVEEAGGDAEARAGNTAEEDNSVPLAPADAQVEHEVPSNEAPICAEGGEPEGEPAHAQEDAVGEEQEGGGCDPCEPLHRMVKAVLPRVAACIDSELEQAGRSGHRWLSLGSESVCTRDLEAIA